MSRNQTRVLFCGCTNSNIISNNVKGQVLATLRAGGADVCVVPDLCGMAARRHPLFKEMTAQGEIVVAACQPRAIRWLFERAGAEVSEAQLRVVNMREENINELIGDLFGGDAPELLSEEEVEMPAPRADGDWPPWFPVIDYDRCVDCKQCLNFCLFGVYEADEHDHVTVAQPQSCKNNCPACARICPEGAIIFPKVNESPINGAAIDDEEALHANIQVNVDKMLGDDVYAALAERKKKRGKMLLRKEAEVKRAKGEREAHREGQL